MSNGRAALSTNKATENRCKAISSVLSKVGFWFVKQAPSVLTGIIDSELPHLRGQVLLGCLNDMSIGAHHVLPKMMKLSEDDPHGVCTTWIATNPAFLLTRPVDIAKIMSLEKNYLTRSPGTDTFAAIYGEENIFNVQSSHPSWSKQRYLYNEALLSPQSLEDLNRHIPDIIREHLEKFKQEKSLELSQFFTHLAMDVVARTLCGSGPLDRKLNHNSRTKLETLHHAIDHTMEAIFEPANNIKLGLMKRLKIAPPWQLKEAKESLYHTFKENIVKPDYKLIDSTKNLLHALTNADIEPVESKEKFYAEKALSHGSFIFLAGHETTSRLMNFIFRMLLLHPEVVEKLKKEFEDAQPIDRRDIESFKYLDQVIKEVLRLFPPVPLMLRSVIKDFDFTLESGKVLKLKKENILIISAWITHRNKLFKNPEQFNPDRWEGEKPAKGAFIPFGSGIRACPGEKMAILEAKWAVFLMLKHMEFTNILKKAEEICAITIQGTLHAAHPLRMNYKPN